jgi:hypothetical protein
MKSFKLASLILLVASLLPCVVLADPQVPKESPNYRSSPNLKKEDQLFGRHYYNWRFGGPNSNIKDTGIHPPYVLTREKLIRFMYQENDADKILANLTQPERNISLNFWGKMPTREKFGDNLGLVEEEHKNYPLYYFKTRKGNYYDSLYYFKDGKDIYNINDFWVRKINPLTHDNSQGYADMMEMLRYEMQLESDNTLYPRTGNDFDGNPMPVRDLPVANLRSVSNADPIQISPSVLRATIASTKWYFEKEVPATPPLTQHNDPTLRYPYAKKPSTASPEPSFFQDSTPEDFQRQWDAAIKTYQTAPDRKGWYLGWFQNRSIPFKLRQLIRIYMEEMATPEDKQKLQDYIQKCVLDKTVV